LGRVAHGVEYRTATCGTGQYPAAKVCRSGGVMACAGQLRPFSPRCVAARTHVPPTVHHTTPGPGLVEVGRIHPDKATADAIEIARRAGRRLTICGPIQDDAYYAEQVAPWVDGDAVRYLGNVGGAQRAEVVGQAAALLHPLGFDEPFGLSVVEAMACGTPVVGYRRGALVETVTDGVTGFLVDNVDAAVSAVTLAVQLDRAAVAREARHRFGADRMVADYLALYRSIVEASSVGGSGPNAF
jgi:glycosyltransferase involved in cell wall biosynthesis